MQHSFDIEIAKQYGVDAAIFLNNIAFWLHKNISNRKHFHDNRYWTYNTQEALLELFPYWSRQNLRTVIKKCFDYGLIIKGNYNNSKYDRTHWYALTDFGLSLYPQLQKSLGENQPMKKMNITPSLVRINQPIPDSNTDINTDKYCASDDAHDGFDDFWKEYPRKENKIRAKKIWKKDKLRDIADLILKDVQNRKIYHNPWNKKQYVPHPSTYLANQQWENEILTANCTEKTYQTNEIRSTVQEWKRGNPDYDRLHRVN